MKPNGPIQSDSPAVLAADGPFLQVPDGFDIFTAQFSRSGDDLVIAAEASPPLTVVGYFAASVPAALVAPNGAMLTGDVVELLAGPRAPGNYAQAGAPDGAVPIGQIEVLTGTATATRASGETVELAQSDPVFQGDVVETGGDSKLGIRLEDGTLASMSAQSRLVLNEFVYDADGSDNWMLVDLIEGSFAFLTGAIAPSGGMEIKTPVAVMAIRGTMPIAIVAENGASQFFAGSDKNYDLLHLTTKQLLAVITSATGYSLGSPDAALQTIDIDPETLDEINELIDVLNDAAASLGFLGIMADSGFHSYSSFGSIGIGALFQFLQLLDATLTEEAIIEVEDANQFLMAEAVLVADPDQADTVEELPVEVDVLANDSHPDGGDLTVVFADVPSGQGTVVITADQQLLYDPGTAFNHLALGETADVVITYAVSHASGAITSTTATVTVTGLNQAPVIVPVAETTANEQTDAQPLETTISLAFSDIDLNNVGHTVEVTGASAAGETSGLTLDDAGLIALLTPGLVTKLAGEAGGSVSFDFSIASGVLDYLAVGEVVTLTYTVEIDDGDGGVTSHSFDVVITGTNDAPVIDVGTSNVSGTVVEMGFDAGGNPVGNPQATGQIAASDIDNGAVIYSVLPAAGAYGVLTVDATGAWTYVLSNSAADHLALGESDTDAFTVTATDHFGGTDEVVVTLTITGANDAPTVSDGSLAAVENGAAIGGSFVGEDVDSDDDGNSLVYTVTAGPGEGTVVNNGDGTFSFDPGEDFQDLAAGETRIVTFTYTATDSHGVVSGTATTTITVTGTNDAPTIVTETTEASGAVSEATDGDEGENSVDHVADGTIAFADVDLSDTHSASFQADAPGYLGSFALGPVDQAGNTVGWSFTIADAALDYLAKNETLVQTYTVTIDDGHGGSVEQIVSVTITGTNDAPTIVGETTEAGGSVTELVNQSGSDHVHEADGSIAFADVDLSDAHSADVVPDGEGYLGTLVLGAIDQAGNAVNWTFTVTDADLDQLPKDAVVVQTYTVTIDDGNGGTVEQTVTITINGNNDAPVIIIGEGDSDSADLQENDGGLEAEGTLTVSDLSPTDVVTASVTEVGVSGNHATQIANGTLLGFLTVTSPVLGSPGADGTLTWTFDSGTEPFDFLAAGEELVLTYTVTVNDGTTTSSREVTVTINGTNDGPEITVGEGDSTGDELEETDAGLQAEGTLSVGDLDISDEVTADVTQVTATGHHNAQISNATLLGFLTVTGTVIGDTATAGTLNWAFDSGSEAFDFLAEGEELVLTYTVAVDDGNGGTETQEVTVTVTGTNDDPTIVAGSTDATGAVTEQAGATYSESNRVDSGTIGFADADLSDTHSASFAPNGSEYLGSFALGGVNQGADSVGWTFTVLDGALDHLAAGQELVQSYTVTIDDGNGGTVEQVVNVTITGTNDAPVTDDVSGLTGFAGTAIEVTLSGSDVDGTVSAFKITTLPTGGGLFLDAQGLVPIDPNNIPASGNEATVYFIPDGEVIGEVGFQYAAIDNSGAQDATPASVGITVETTKIYITISQDTWQGGADLPTFQNFTVTVAGVTYKLSDLTVIDSNFYGQDGEGFTLGIGTGSGNKDRFVTFEIDGVPAGATAEISFDYMVTDRQGEAFQDGVRFFAGDSPDDMVLFFDGDEHAAFTGNEDNAKFSSRVLSFDYALIAGALAISNQELTATIDPIVLDLGAPGFDLSGTASFDLDADGQAETLAWTGGEDAMLVMDLDGSGSIDSGREVFSPFFGSGGFADALAALASLDGNGDGVLDGKDEAFADLLAWVDANSDGESQPDELTSLADLGIVSFDLDAGSVAYQIDGQSIVAEGQFTRADGTTGNYVAVELDRILDSAEPLIAGNDGSDIDAPDHEVAATGLSIDDVLVDYRDGSSGPDMAEIAFAMATGQEDSAPAEVDPASELSLPPDIIIKLTQQHDAANGDIA